MEAHRLYRVTDFCNRVRGGEDHGGDDHPGAVGLGLGDVLDLLLDRVVVMDEAHAAELRDGKSVNCELYLWR